MVESSSKAIWGELDRDPFARICLSRGIINQRALAREILARLKLKSSMSGAVSAIQRYARTQTHNPLDTTFSVMRNLRIASRTHVVTISLRKERDTFQLLPKLFNTVDWSKGEALRVVQAEETVKVFLDERNRETFLKLIPAQLRLEVKRGLAELDVHLSPAAMRTPGTIMTLLSGLFAKSINVEEVLVAGPEVLIFLAESDLTGAHQAIMNFAGAPPA